MAKILFVDDEDLVCRAFERALRSSEYDVTSCTLAADGLEKVRTEYFDLVVVDLRLPDTDGLTLIEKMSRLRPNLVFLISTGMPDLNLRRSDETKDSILATLAKPWDQAELLELVDRAFQLRRSVRRQSEAPECQRSALLVEDDDADAYIIEEELKHGCGLEVVRVTRVCDAEILLSRREFDFVVSDLALPDARGTDAVRRLRRAATHAPLIVLSGIANTSVATQVMRHGAQDFMTKGAYTKAMLRRALELAEGRVAYVGTLMELAQHDQLTGLANRRTLRGRFAFASNLAKESGAALGFISIDLDGFKEVNDALGHAAGDFLLRHVARLLETVVREGDTVARLGGDEFGVLLCNLDDESGANLVVARIKQAMAEPIEFSQSQIQPRMSIGVETVTKGPTTLDELMRAADTRMYASKRASQGDRRGGVVAQ